MRRFIARSLAMVLAMSGIATVAQAAPQGALQRIEFGDSTSLTQTQEADLTSYWADTEGPGKFICSGLYIEGADFDLRVRSRLQAKLACDFLSQEYGLENWYQAKPTAVASFVGSVYIRVKLDETAAAPDSESDESSPESSTSATVSKTTSLPDVDFSSSTVSPEVADLAVEKIAALDSPSEVVCTSVVSPNFSAEQRERALTKAKKICEALAERTGSTVRHQVKTSTSSWVGRVMLTSIWSPSSAGNSTAEDKKTEQETKSEESESEETAPAPAPNPPSRPVSRPPATSPVGPSPTPSEPSPTPAEPTTPETPEEIQPRVRTPDFSISGLDFYGSVLLGSQVTLADSNALEGETVSCRWYRDNRLGGTYSSDCAITISTQMFRNNLYLDATFTSESGSRLVTADLGVIDYLNFRSAPSFSIGGTLLRNRDGDITWGSTVTVETGPIDDGARLSCVWYHGSNYVDGERISNNCELPIELDSWFLGHWVEVYATVSKTGYRSSSSRMNIGRPSGARDFLSPPEFSIAGDIFRNSDGDITWGSTVTVETGPIDDGARLSCLWYTGRSWVTGTRWSTECSLPISLDSPFLGKYVEVRAEVSKPGYRSSTTILNISRPSGWRDFVLSPETSISGRYAVGSSLQLDVGPVDDGARISCLWYTGDSYPYAARAERWSTDCTLQVTPDSGFLGQYLRARVTISKTGYATIIRSLVAGRLQQ